MAKAPARSGKPVSRGPKAAAKAKRPTKARSKPQGIAPLPPENLARARIKRHDDRRPAADRGGSLSRHTRARLPGLARSPTGELRDGALRRARSLQALGVRPRDHVGMLMHTCAEFVETVLRDRVLRRASSCRSTRATSRTNWPMSSRTATSSTVVTTDAVAEHVNFVERLNRRAAGPAAQPRPAQAARWPVAPKLRNIVLLGRTKRAGFVTAARLRRRAPRRARRSDVHRARLRVRVRDVALMLYTSGTTANPKGCLITHEARCATASRSAAIATG